MLTHLLSQIDQPAIREEIVQRSGGIFKGHVIWGEDLLQLDVGAGGVGGIEPR